MLLPPTLGADDSENTMKRAIAIILYIVVLMAIGTSAYAAGIRKEINSVSTRPKTYGEDDDIFIDKIPESWFDDAIFIGDSQIGALSIYALMQIPPERHAVSATCGMSIPEQPARVSG